MNQAQIASKFVPTGMGNDLLQCDGFSISYNPNAGMGISMFAADTDGGETAIVAGGQFFILNGDFRYEYAALVEDGLKACLTFFAGKPDLVSSWSGSADEAKALAEAV